jgi:glutathione S-transferase
MRHGNAGRLGRRNERKHDMKLYYSPGACSLSPHIVSREAGIALDLIRVDTKTHKTADGGDFYKVNPMGYVPTLVLDDGEILTEGPAIVQYLADQKPDSGLMPKGRDRYRVLEWLNFVTAELHKQFTPLFKPDTPEAYKTIVKEGLVKKFALLDEKLKGRSFLTGETFTVADAYLFVVANWSRFHDIDLAQWPNLKAFMDRVKTRPAVQEAMKAEGLIKAA